MTEVFRKVIMLLTPTERRYAYVLLGMVLVMALLDVIGIASIMPFMAIATTVSATSRRAHRKAQVHCLPGRGSGAG
jgi:hypothetical protein